MGPLLGGMGTRRREQRRTRCRESFEGVRFSLGGRGEIKHLGCEWAGGLAGWRSMLKKALSKKSTWLTIFLKKGGKSGKIKPYDDLKTQ